jgi:hypothetical protein
MDTIWTCINLSDFYQKDLNKSSKFKEARALSITDQVGAKGTVGISVAGVCSPGFWKSQKGPMVQGSLFLGPYSKLVVIWFSHLVWRVHPILIGNGQESCS